MVDKMIKYTKIEICLIILFLIISIPLWKYLEKQLNENYTLAVNAETSLSLYLNNTDDYDNVIVDNSYLIFKKYALLLKVSENIDKEYITINNIKYKISNFSKQKIDNNHIYTLTTKIIKGTRNGYKIDLDLSDKSINYSYSIKEITDF